MSFLEEVRDVKHHFLLWGISFLSATVVIFSIGINKINLLGREWYVPWPSMHSLAVILFEAFKRDLLPKEVVLVTTSPTSVFATQMNISFFGAFIVTLPFLLYAIGKYLSPALYQREKSAALKLVAPSVLLFISGAIFAYIVLIPPTFAILYSFNDALGVAPFLHVEEFIDWIVSMLFATGIAFLLPIFMYLTSRIGMIPPRFWRAHWRGAVMTFLIVSAIVTPDPSGIAMIFVSLPLFLLYGVGILLSRSAQKRSAPKEI